MISYFILITLLCLSFFFSGTETAVTAVSTPLLFEKAKQGNKRAKLLNIMKKDSATLISTLLLGNNIVNIAITAISTALCIDAFGESWGVLIATFGVSFVVLIFSEILPKTYAMSHATEFALFVTPALYGIVIILKPFAKGLNIISKGLMKILHLKAEKKTSEEELKAEIRGAISLPEDKEMMGQERYMMKSVLELADVDISDIMMHRSQMVSLNAALPIDEIINFVSRSPYSRIPLWSGKRDNIIGILHSKALLKLTNAYYGGNKKINIRSYLTKPWFVLDTTSVMDQLHAFKKRREHFAIVVDEYGAVQGLVTLEDVLEEIVGDISDETDTPAISTLQVTKTESGSFRVDGNTTIRDLNRHFGWELPDEHATTIAGYIMYEIERIPSVGQSFAIKGFTFSIVGKERNHITCIDIIPPAN